MGSNTENARLTEAMQASMTAYGAEHDGLRLAHADSDGRIGQPRPRLSREQRENLLEAQLSERATRPRGAGQRRVAEEPDPTRLCFEVDSDRIRTSAAFRRLAGKCQVFMAPSNDMIRTRLTHAIEVAQVAVNVSNALGLCTSLAEAIAIGHDCGHGPGGHSAEDAFDPYLPGGFDHAAHGADVVLAPLNLCRETLDGIRQHSWKLAAPATPEGEVCSHADRISYVAHDMNDGIRAGLFSIEDLPRWVTDRIGHSQAEHLQFFTEALIRVGERHGRIGLEAEDAALLDELRKFNYERIYLRPASMRQAERVVRLLRGLVEFYIDAPLRIPDVAAGLIVRPDSGSPEAVRLAVDYVASMTDRYAMAQAVEHLGWDRDDLPRSI